MQGGVNYRGSTLLSGGINVNTTGNIQALNVQVTENGERTITPPEGVDGYAPITIDTNVPIPEPILNTLNATSNGTYTPPSGVDGYDVVNVSVPGPVLDNISITANGTYTPPSGVDGYDEVNVSVPTPEPVLDTLNVTSNGTYTPPSGVDGYDEVNVSVSGYTIKTLPNTPTPIATFSDGTDNPLKSLTASIVPVQAGSGDPSPTNVRPISGWDVVDVIDVGKNKSPLVSSTTSSSGGLESNSNKIYEFIKQGKTYTLSFDMIVAQKSETTQGNTLSVWLNNKSPSIVRFPVSSTGRQTVTFTASSDGFLNFWSGTNSYDANTKVIDNIQLKEGTTYTIPFTDGQGQSVTVYGGEIDVINGVVTPCPYYASYNGEQLTGEWISDRDVYSPNTTPTIGAQVVNIGATGTPFNTQPTSIKSLDGENNVSASTGDVEDLKYFADL